MAVVKVNYKQLVDLGMKVLTFMTWPIILKTIVIAVLTIGGYTLWENRQPIYEGIRVNNNRLQTMIAPPISESSVKAIDDLLSKPSPIVAIQLVAVDFSENARNTVLFRSNIPAMTAIMERYQRNKLGSTAFFIPGDTVNNNRNVSIMNGEFVCVRFKDIIAFTRFPDLNTHSEYLCSISLPPYPGSFSGYITLYLKSEPSANELSDIRAAARKLAAELYDREVVK